MRLRFPLFRLWEQATPLRSICLILVSMFCFSVVDALGKSVALQYSADHVTFFRMLFGLTPKRGWWWVEKTSKINRDEAKNVK